MNEKILALEVVNHGGTIYLKIPRGINQGLGFMKGDTVQVAIQQILSKGDLKK